MSPGAIGGSSPGGGGSSAPNVTSPGNLGAARSVALSPTQEQWLIGAMSADLTVTFTSLSAGERAVLVLAQDTTPRTLTLTDGASPFTVGINTAPGTVTVVTVYYDGTKLTGSADGSPLYLGLFGDGSDGALVFDGAATVAGLVPAANVYTMTRDIFATTVLVNNGITIKTQGYRIFSIGPVTVNGILQNDGFVGGNNGTANAAVASMVMGSTGGGGATAAGAIGTVGVIGGGSGAGGLGPSGAGGGAANYLNGSTVAQWQAYLRIPHAAAVNALTFGSTAGALRGGASGGGGGGDGTNKGGAGGNGGGAIIIFAYSFTLGATGSILARGGAGGSPATGNAGGGGGGGGGGLLAYTRVAWTLGGTVTLTGGAGGTPVGTGVVGTAGGAGWSQNVVLV